MFSDNDLNNGEIVQIDVQEIKKSYETTCDPELKILKYLQHNYH